MNKTENVYSLFQPTFGNRPEQYIGRDGVIEQFMAGLAEPVGSRNRCTLFLGQRGMGKTALLLELSDRAQKAGYVVARVPAHEGMPQAIIEQFQLNNVRGQVIDIKFIASWHKRGTERPDPMSFALRGAGDIYCEETSLF